MRNQPLQMPISIGFYVILAKLLVIGSVSKEYFVKVRANNVAFRYADALVCLVLFVGDGSLWRGHRELSTYSDIDTEATGNAGGFHLVFQPLDRRRSGGQDKRIHFFRTAEA